MQPVAAPLKESFVPVRVPGAVGAPYFSTHDISKAVIVDGLDLYLAYFGQGSYVIKYDAQTKKWSPPVLLGGISDDQYRYPEIAMDHSGYIHAFYGGHGGFGPVTGFYYRRTVRPRDISEWTPEREVGKNASLIRGTAAAFPRPYVLRDGRIILFHRGSRADGKDYGWGYIESSDGGRTWSEFTRLVDDEYTLYGSGTLVEREGQPPTILWGWCWWDRGVCDLGEYYSPSLAVPCKYDDAVFAAFPIGQNMYLDAGGTPHPLPVKRDVIEPLWKEEWLCVADSTVNDQGDPVVLFGDYKARRVDRMLVAAHTKREGWVVEEPVPGLPVAFTNMRILHAAGWTTIVCWATGEEPGLYVIQRRGTEGKWYVRRLTHQFFPYQMHPMIKEDLKSNRIHIFWGEGDRISPSRIMYGSIPLSPIDSRQGK